MAQPLADNIKSDRISAGVKRKDLARAVDISYVHMANIENGHTTAAPETLYRIARELRVPIDRVMVPVDSRPGPPRPVPPPHPGPRTDKDVAA